LRRLRGQVASFATEHASLHIEAMARGVYEPDPFAVCEPLEGTIDVLAHTITCDGQESWSSTCWGDVDLTITVPRRGDRRWSGTLRVVEHSHVTTSWHPFGTRSTW
jgi:hypothetical protein